MYFDVRIITNAIIVIQHINIINNNDGTYVYKGLQFILYKILSRYDKPIVRGIPSTICSYGYSIYNIIIMFFNNR